MPARVRMRSFILLMVLALQLGTAADDGAAHQLNQTLPIALGTSGGNAGDISNLYCCSGTLGALVTKNNLLYVLSANHIFTRNDQALPGQMIIQPGLIDNSCSVVGANHVADFAESPPLGTANVDAALATV